MLAGLLIISVVSGTAGSLVALLMAQPVWVALLAYPVTGVFTLLTVALLLALRGSAKTRPSEMATALATHRYTHGSN